MGLFDPVRGALGGGDDESEDDEGEPEPVLPPEHREPTPTNFRNMAVDAAQDWDDLDLDFSVASLERLDGFAKRQNAKLELMRDEQGDEAASEAHTAFTLHAGSYFGEVLARSFDGKWVRNGERWAIEVPGGGDSSTVHIFEVAAHSFAEQPAFAEVAREVGPDDDGDDDESDREETADVGAEMRPEAESFAHSWTGYDLDFSAASLARLDELASEEWDAERFTDAAVGGEDMDAQMYTKLVKQLGAYYGEVLVRTLDGEWTHRGDELVVGVTGDAETTEAVFDVAAAALDADPDFLTRYRRVAQAARLSVPDVDPEEARAAGTDHGPAGTDSADVESDQPDAGAGDASGTGQPGAETYHGGATDAGEAAAVPDSEVDPAGDETATARSEAATTPDRSPATPSDSAAGSAGASAAGQPASDATDPAGGQPADDQPTAESGGEPSVFEPTDEPATDPATEPASEHDPTEASTDEPPAETSTEATATDQSPTETPAADHTRADAPAESHGRRDGVTDTADTGLPGEPVGSTSDATAPETPDPTVLGEPTADPSRATTGDTEGAGATGGTRDEPPRPVSDYRGQPGETSSQPDQRTAGDERPTARSGSSPSSDRQQSPTTSDRQQSAPSPDRQQSSTPPTGGSRGTDEPAGASAGDDPHAEAAESDPDVAAVAEELAEKADAGPGGSQVTTIDDLREDAAAFAATWPSYDLDYSPESLQRLDDLVAEEYETDDDTDQQYLTDRAAEAGGYFAEVVHRTLGGQWAAEPTPEIVVEGRVDEKRIDPVTLAVSCFQGNGSFAGEYATIQRELSLSVSESNERSL